MVVRNIALFMFKEGKTVDGEKYLKGYIDSARRARGCIQVKLLRSIDDSNVYLTITEWQSLEDAVEFMSTYRRAPTVSMEHYLLTHMLAREPIQGYFEEIYG